MTTNENSILFEYSFVSNVIHDENGGVIYCSKEDFVLVVFYSTFNQCHVNESKSLGGAIYFNSSHSSITVKRVSVSECSSSEGHFLYTNDLYEANSCLQFISTEKTFGDHRCVIMLFSTSLYAIYYNSSYCRTDHHGNLHTLKKAANTSASFLNFYKCHSDILYGTDCHVEKSTGSVKYVNFLENEESQGQFGFLFTHSVKDYILYSSYICCYKNTHTLLCGMDSYLVIDNLYCDELTTTSSISIESPSFSATKPILFEFNIFNKIHFTPDHKKPWDLHFSILTSIFIMFS